MRASLHPSGCTSLPLLPVLYSYIAVWFAFQLYRILIHVGRWHAYFLAPGRIADDSSVGDGDGAEVNTYPQEALFGYDWYVWRFMVPWVWRADTILPERLFDAGISSKTIEIGPGSAWFPRRSAVLHNLVRRGLLTGQQNRIVYDLVDLHHVPLQYTHARMQDTWVRVAKNAVKDGVLSLKVGARLEPLLPVTRRFAADVTSPVQLEKVLETGQEEGYDSLVANMIIHCIPYSGADSDLSNPEKAQRKMEIILTGMAKLLRSGGTLVGCTGKSAALRS